MKNMKVDLFDRKVDARTVFFLGMMFSFVAAIMVYPQAVVLAGDVSDAGNVVTTKFNELNNLVAGIISSLGMLITMWGISEWGIAFQSSEGTMQAQSLKRIAGGIVMSLAPQLAPVLLG